ncbi:hypothetical protein SDC9_176634 [bioreactor metagenome]|uniref:Uncharacterized protein n=1 Tax=bioreactor metagenome TaxID=1076179 RepID=A0A645GZX7_9ZZZZ
MIWENMHVLSADLSMMRQMEFQKQASHRAQSGKNYPKIGSALSAVQQKRNLRSRVNL